MTVSIISCPSCKSMLLSDTLQCPTCQHVLKPEQMETPPDVKTASARRKPAAVEEECPKCGEMVRRGLVRCWNCGTFMRKDIAESYRKMQQPAAPTGFHELPEVPTAGKSKGVRSRESESGPSIDEDDFELDPEFAAQASDDDFETDVPFAAQEAAASQSSNASASPGSAATPSAPSEPSGASAETDAEASPEGTPDGPGDDAVPHSVATGGDVLWKAALQEEAETKQRKSAGGRRQSRVALTTRGGFLVHCPHGHRIEVQERHRGQTGRCPRCKAVFIVPDKPWDEEAEQAKRAAESVAKSAKKKAADKPAYQYNRWMTDVHVHAVDPQKLKLKPGSLANAFQPMDIGFSVQGMLMVTLQKKGGLFGSVDKKKLEAAREGMRAHLQEGKPLDELPVAEKRIFDAVDVRHIRVVQPIRYEFESMFAGVPVFGKGRIAVHLPKPDDAAHPQFASFFLSDFREFARILEDLYDVAGLGEECDVPLTDSFSNLKCHYTEHPLRALEQVEFYEADPNYELKLIGRRCQGCGLIVSEDARKKEKIGGVSGKGIARAKCPKCKGKFGNVSLYEIEKGPEPPPTSAEEQTPDDATPETNDEK